MSLVTIFTATGTYSVTSAVDVEVFLVGGGGGGGSGPRRATATLKTGGGGGGGAAWNRLAYPASVLSSPETVTIGTGGPGGVSVTSNDTNGNAGSAGVDSTFGNLLRAKAGSGGGAGNN